MPGTYPQAGVSLHCNLNLETEEFRCFGCSYVCAMTNFPSQQASKARKKSQQELRCLHIHSPLQHVAK